MEVGAGPLGLLLPLQLGVAQGEAEVVWERLGD